MQKNHIFILKVILHSLLLRRSRLAVALMGIAIGATVLLGMVTLCYDIPRQLSREFRSYGANMVFVAAGKTALMQMPDVEAAAAFLPQKALVGLTPYRYETVRSNMLPYTAVGTRFDQVRKTSPYWQIQGAWPANDGEIMIGTDVAEFTKFGVGKTLTLEGRNKEQARYEKDVTVVGIVRTGGLEDEFIFMGLNDMEDMTGDYGYVDVAEISIAAPAQELSALADIIRAKNLRVEPRLVKRVTQSEETVLSKLQALVYLVTLVVLALTMICVATTMMTVIMERRKEIGLKKALGAENKRIAREFLAEGLILGVIGGIAGVICGLIFAQVVSVNVFHRWITLEFYLIPLTIIISAAVTVAACLIPVRRAVSVDPALVLRGE